MPCYAQIIIQFATVNEIDRPFTYEVAPEISSRIQVGQRVKVPFGRYNHLQLGYVVKLMNEVQETGYRLKKVAVLIDEKPILDNKQLELISFIVDYYATSYAAAIDVVLPPGLKEEPIAVEEMSEKKVRLVEDRIKLKAYCNANAHKQTFAKQKWLIDYLREHTDINQKELLALPEVSASSLKTLEKNGCIYIEEEKVVYRPDPICEMRFKTLNDQQEQAVQYLKALNEANVYRTILLEGVTGSGKTEVFLHAIREVLMRGGTALVLVPEIALTDQTLFRFKERFGNRVALSHSRMSAKERQRLYMRAKNNEVSIIIGPRSAVFMPLDNLKLIVVDEAHESSYKSETTPKYHAIDIAKKRMMQNKGQVLLATATPSIESYAAARSGEYSLLTLNKRIGEAVLPEVDIVDMRLEIQKGNNSVLSHTLFEAIKDALEADGQVMLLLNRRGYSTFINCRSCGHVIKCDHCDVSMTYHASQQILQCHYCGKTSDVPEVCPECGSKYIRFMGSGTEKVEAYLKECFGNYGVARMDMDTTTGKEGHQKILSAFRKKEVRLLIGTQMIAKGHDFPAVTLVGVLSADLSLFMQDFRSNERTYQLLTQAMGRAGRGKEKGRVVIQTYNPNHLVMEVIRNNAQEAFYEQELANREMLGYPPYTHIFSLLVSGLDEEEVIRTIQLLSQYYRYYSQKGQSHFRVIGPTSAVISKIGDEYRWRLLIVGEEREKLLIYGKFCLEKFYNKEKVSGTKIQWDVDPLAML